ncbi:MAG: DICT sensory domain-containing protein [Prochlorotrichaceae cyanobacterium]
MLNGSLLQRLQAAHAVTARPLKFGVYYKQTLVALCHALEDYILQQAPKTPEERPLLVTAFQQGKWYLQEADRYRDLAQQSSAIVIMAQPDAGFAEHPTSQAENVHLVHLQPSDPVAQEWHLIILSPCYTAMVLCQELSVADYGEKGQPQSDLERKFYGFWTFEPELVEETVHLALTHIEPYDRTLVENLHRYVEHYQRPTLAFEGLSEVVSNVVDYLSTSQHALEAQCSLTLVPAAIGSQTLKVQAIDHNLVSNEVQAFLRMAQILDQSDLSNPCAAAEVATLTEALGQLLNLPVWQLRRLRLAALLHRLDPLRSSQSVLNEGLNANEPRLSCPLVPAAQVLRRMPQLRAIAQIITHLTERWDGQGQPAGLATTEIPLESRILGLVTEFQHSVAALVNEGHAVEEALQTTLAACQQDVERRWDPQIFENLALLVNGLLSGWDLNFSEQRVAAGLWLLGNELPR